MVKKGGTKEELVEALSILTGQPPSHFKNWSLNELNQRLDAFRQEEEMEQTEKQDLIGEITEKMGEMEIAEDLEDMSVKELRERLDTLAIESQKPSSELTEDVEVEEETPAGEDEEDKQLFVEEESDDEEELKTLQKAGRAQTKIGSAKVVDVLRNITTGESKISDLSEAQNAVLACLGLVSA